MNKLYIYASTEYIDMIVVTSALGLDVFRAMMSFDRPGPREVHHRPSYMQTSTLVWSTAGQVTECNCYNEENYDEGLHVEWDGQGQGYFGSSGSVLHLRQVPGQISPTI